MGTWHAFIRSRAFSGLIHNRNGDNTANIVAKLTQKIDGEMAGEYGGVQRPPSLLVRMTLIAHSLESGMLD